MRSLFFLAVYIGLFFSGLSARAEALVQTGELRFEDLPDLVRQRNENVAAAKTTVSARKAREGFLGRSFFPKVDVAVGSEAFESGPVNLTNRGYWRAEATLNLYRGGRDSLENDIRKSKTESSRVSLVKEFRDELREAQRAYWSLTSINQEIAERQDALKKNQLNLRAARRRTGAGVATSTDSLQFDLHQTLLNQELKKLEHERHIVSNELALSIGAPAEVPLEVSGSFPHPAESSFENLKIESSQTPDYQNLSVAENAASLQAKKDSRWWTPRLDLYSSYGLPNISDETDRAIRGNTEFTLGFRLGLSLPEGFDHQTDAAANRFEAQALKSRLSHRKKEIDSAIEEARHELVLHHELIHDADKDIEQAKEFLRLTEGEYNRGVKNGPDLLGAFQKYYEFRNRRTALYKEFYQTLADVMTLTQKLGEEI